MVAPAANCSGTGNQATFGTLTASAKKTISGYPATAVNGFPVDTITYAMSHLGLHPDLVVSGINFGQNLGPVASISGTVGAAEAAAARGVLNLNVPSCTSTATRFDADIAAFLAGFATVTELDATGAPVSTTTTSPASG